MSDPEQSGDLVTADRLLSETVEENHVSVPQASGEVLEEVATEAAVAVEVAAAEEEEKEEEDGLSNIKIQVIMPDSEEGKRLTGLATAVPPVEEETASSLPVAADGATGPATEVETTTTAASLEPDTPASLPTEHDTLVDPAVDVDKTVPLVVAGSGDVPPVAADVCSTAGESMESQTPVGPAVDMDKTVPIVVADNGTAPPVAADISATAGECMENQTPEVVEVRDQSSIREPVSTDQGNCDVSSAATIGRDSPVSQERPLPGSVESITDEVPDRSSGAVGADDVQVVDTSAELDTDVVVTAVTAGRGVDPFEDTESTTCPLCGHKAINVGDLLVHFLYHTDYTCRQDVPWPRTQLAYQGNNYLCHTCGIKTRLRLLFREHVRHHVLPSSYSCEKCGGKYMSIKGYKSHCSRANHATNTLLINKSSLVDNVIRKLGPMAPAADEVFTLKKDPPAATRPPAAAGVRSVAGSVNVSKSGSNAPGSGIIQVASPAIGQKEGSMDDPILIEGDESAESSTSGAKYKIKLEQIEDVLLVKLMRVLPAPNDDSTVQGELKVVMLRFRASEPTMEGNLCQYTCIECNFSSCGIAGFRQHISEELHDMFDQHSDVCPSCKQTKSKAAGGMKCSLAEVIELVLEQQMKKSSSEQRTLAECSSMLGTSFSVTQGSQQPVITSQAGHARSTCSYTRDVSPLYSQTTGSKEPSPPSGVAIASGSTTNGHIAGADAHALGTSAQREQEPEVTDSQDSTVNNCPDISESNYVLVPSIPLFDVSDSGDSDTGTAENGHQSKTCNISGNSNSTNSASHAVNVPEAGDVPETGDALKGKIQESQTNQPPGAKDVREENATPDMAAGPATVTGESAPQAEDSTSSTSLAECADAETTPGVRKDVPSVVPEREADTSPVIAESMLEQTCAAATEKSDSTATTVSTATESIQATAVSQAMPSELSAPRETARDSLQYSEVPASETSPSPANDSSSQAGQFGAEVVPPKNPGHLTSSVTGDLKVKFVRRQSGNKDVLEIKRVTPDTQSAKSSSATDGQKNPEKPMKPLDSLVQDKVSLADLDKTLKEKGISYTPYQKQNNGKRFFAGKFKYENGFYSCLSCNMKTNSENTFRNHCSKHVHKKMQCSHCPDHIKFNKIGNCPVLQGLMDMVRRVQIGHQQWRIQLYNESQKPGSDTTQQQPVPQAGKEKVGTAQDHAGQEPQFRQGTSVNRDMLQAPQNEGKEESKKSADGKGLSHPEKHPCSPQQVFKTPKSPRSHGRIHVSSLAEKLRKDKEKELLEAGNLPGSLSASEYGIEERVALDLPAVPNTSRCTPYTGRKEPRPSNTEVRKDPPPNPTGEKFIFKCAFVGCDFQTLEDNNFKLHNLVKHALEKDFPCSICGRHDNMFASEDDLLEHLNVHRGPVYQCYYPDCNFGAVQVEDYGNHLSAEHPGESTYRCCFCDKKTELVMDIIGHAKLHVRLQIKCPYCGLTSADKKEIQTHISRQHKDLPKKLIVLRNVVKDLTELEVAPTGETDSAAAQGPSGRTGANSRPPSVPMTVSSEASTLGMEASQVDHPLPQIQSVTSLPMLADSPMSPSEDDDTGGLEDVENMSDDDLSSESEEPEPIQKVELKKCDQCTFLAPDDAALISHQQYHKTSQSRACSFLCRSCPFSENDKSSFRLHVQLHPGQHKLRYYICSHCAYSSTQMGRIEDHLSDEHPDAEFKFEVSQEALEHLQLMSACEICNLYMDSSNPELMSEHVATAHPVKEKPSKDGGVQIDRFHCDMCYYSTYSRTILKKHMKTEHAGGQGSIVRPRQVPTHASSLSTQNIDDQITGMVRTKSGVSKPIFECSVCGFETSRRPLFETHVSSHKTGHELLKCPMCPYQSDSAKNMHKHQRIHSRKIQSGFTCGYCDFTTTLKSRCSWHITTYHPGKPKKFLEYDGTHPKTKQTSRKSTTKNSLGHPSSAPHHISHDKSHSSAAVPSENQGGPDTLLPRSLQNVSLADFEVSLPDVMVFPHDVQCPRCSFCTRSRVNLVRHLKIHSGTATATCPTDTQDEANMTNKQTADEVADPDGNHLEPQQDTSTDYHAYCSKVPNMDLHKCLECSFVHMFASEVKQHYQTEHVLYRCGHCVHRTRNLQKCKEHCVLTHGRDLRILCKYNNGLEELLRDNSDPRMEGVIIPTPPTLDDGDEEVDGNDAVACTSAMTGREREHVLKFMETTEVAGKVKSTCTVCNYTTEHTHLVRRHILAVHMKFNRFLCKYCGLGKMEVTQIKQHVKSRHPGKSLRVIKKAFDPEKHGKIVQTEGYNFKASPEKYARPASQSSASVSGTPSRSYSASPATTTPGASDLPASANSEASTPVPRNTTPPVQIKQEVVDEDYALALSLSEGHQTRSKSGDLPSNPQYSSPPATAAAERVANVLPELLPQDHQYPEGQAVKGKKRFGCAYCDYCSVYGRRDVQRHVLKVHLKMDIFHCGHSNCSYHTMGKAKMLEHQRMRHSKKKFRDETATLDKIIHIHTNSDVMVYGFPEGELSKLQAMLEQRSEPLESPAKQAKVASSPTMSPVSTAPTQQSSQSLFGCLYCEYVSGYSKRDVQRHIVKNHIGLDVFVCGHESCDYMSNCKARMMDHQQLRHHKVIIKDQVETMEQIIFRAKDGKIPLFGFSEGSDYDVEIQKQVQGRGPFQRSMPVKLATPRKSNKRPENPSPADVLESTAPELRELDAPMGDILETESLESFSTANAATGLGGKKNSTRDTFTAFSVEKPSRKRNWEADTIVSDTSGHDSVYPPGAVIYESKKPNYPKMKAFICEYCSYTTKHTRSDMKKHILHSHLKLKTYSCGWCDYDSWHPTQIESHHKLEHPGKDPKVIFSVTRVGHMIVPKRVQKGSEMVMGVAKEYEAKQLHKSTMFQCKLCQVQGPNVSKIKWHVIIKHWKAKPYRCPVCPHDAFTRGECARHVKEHHPGHDLEPASVMQEKAAELQQRIKKVVLFDGIRSGIQEMIKEGVFGDVASSDSGRVNLKSPPPLQRAPTPNQQPSLLEQQLLQRPVLDTTAAAQAFSCDKCSFSTSRQDYLDAHMVTHCVYACIYCTFQAPAKASVQKHCLQEHPEFPVKVRMSVPTVGDGHPSEPTATAVLGDLMGPPALKKQKRPLPIPQPELESVVPEGEELLPTMPRKTYMGQLSKNTGEVLYVCKYCKFRGVNLTSIRHHVMRHFNYNPYSCPYCSSCVSVKNFQVKQHILTHHPLKQLRVLHRRDEVMEANVREGWVKMNKHGHKIAVRKSPTKELVRPHLKVFPVRYRPVAGASRPKKSPGMAKPRKDVNQIGRLICPLCDTSCTNLCTLRRHLMRELDYKPYSCAICGHRDIMETFIKLHFTSKHVGMNWDQYNCSAALDENKQVYIKELIAASKTARERQLQEFQNHNPGAAALEDHGMPVNAAPPSASITAMDTPEEYGVEEQNTENEDDNEASAYLDRVTQNPRHQSRKGMIDPFPESEAPVYRCQYCAYWSHRKKLLFNHQRQVHGERNWKCAYCEARMPYKSQLVRHLRFLHRNKPMKFICLNPKLQKKEETVTTGMKVKLPGTLAFQKKKQTASKSSATIATSLVAQSRPSEATLRETQVKREELVSNAQAEAMPLLEGSPMGFNPKCTPDGWYECPHCTYRTMNREHYKMHTLKHQPPNWVCGHCDKRYRMLFRLRRHCKTSHPGAPLIWENLATKEKGVNPIDAPPLRGMTLGTTSSTPQVSTGEQSAVKAPVLSPASQVQWTSENVAEPKYCCDKCSFYSISTDELLQHIQANHVPGSSSQIRESPKPKPTPGVQCGFCEYTACYPSEVKRHLVRKHPGLQIRYIQLPPAEKTEDEDDVASVRSVGSVRSLGSASIKSGTSARSSGSKKLRSISCTSVNLARGIQVAVRVQDVLKMTGQKLQQLLHSNQVRTMNL